MKLFLFVVCDEIRHADVICYADITETGLELSVV